MNTADSTVSAPNATIIDSYMVAGDFIKRFAGSALHIAAFCEPSVTILFRDNHAAEFASAVKLLDKVQTWTNAESRSSLWVVSASGWWQGMHAHVQVHVTRADVIERLSTVPPRTSPLPALLGDATAVSAPTAEAVSA